MRDFLSAVEGLADLVLWRDGGQRQARRNAWRAMVDDNARARARAEAADAMHEPAVLAAGPRDETALAVGGPT